MGMRNMAKKRAPVTVVAVAMALPVAAKTRRPQMCRLRSAVRALDQVARMETAKVRNQTVRRLVHQGLKVSCVCVIYRAR